MINCLLELQSSGLASIFGTIKLNSGSSGKLWLNGDSVAEYVTARLSALAAWLSMIPSE